MGRDQGALRLVMSGGLGACLLTPCHGVAEVPPEVLEPRVTIEEFANRSEEAYWLNQRRVAIKVTPRHGTPYYLVDPDANGQYEMRRAGPDIDAKPSMWKLADW